MYSNKELIIKLKNYKRKTGQSYGDIAKIIGVKKMSLYDFMKNNRPAWKMNIILNNFFEKKENNNE